MSSRGSGDFSAVARVLFDSAAKSGIVSNESRKLFAKQLQKLAGQSKRQGGSLEGVSAKMSQLVERETPRGIWKRPYGQRSDARGVPSLQIPTPTKGHGQGEGSAGTAAGAPAAHASGTEAAHRDAMESLTLKLSIPGLIRKRTTPTVATPSPPGAPPRPSSTHATAAQSPPSSGSDVVPSKAPDTRESSAPKATSPTLRPVPPVEVDPAPRRAFVAVEAEDADMFKNLKSLKQTEGSASEAEATPRRVERMVPKPAAVVAPPVGIQAAAAAKKPTPRLFVPSTPTATTSAADATLAPSIPSFDDPMTTSSSFSSVSVDEWELQREQEINQLQAAQREQDERLAAEAERERHRVLGEEWAEARKNVSRPFRSDDPFLALNERLYFATSWEGSLHAFHEMSQRAATAGPTQQLPEHAVHTLLRRVRQVPHVQRHDVLARVQEQLKGLPNAAALTHIVELHLRPPPRLGPDAVEASLAAPPRPPLSLFATEFREAIQDAQWERAMELYDKAVIDCAPSLVGRRGTTTLEKIAAAAIARSSIGRQRKKELGKVLTNAARKKSRGQVLDRPTALLLARLVGGGFARSILPPIESQDADEEVLARHMDACPEDEVARLVEEAMQLGYNLRDPQVVAALGRRAMYSPDPMKVYAMIQEQAADSVALNRTHVTLAVDALSKIRTKEAAAATLKVVESVGQYGRRHVLRRVLPVLYELGLVDDILKLYEANREVIDFPRDLPTVTLFVNSALKSKELTPLSDGDASSLARRSVAQTADGEGTATAAAASGRGEEGGSKAAAHSLEHIASTDTMLEYAKERNWQAAMSVLSRLPRRIHSSQASTATLLFNCALSAATDAPDLVEAMFGHMQAREDVALNSTTYNTAMSAFAKSSDKWGRALEMYQSMPIAQRDASTYSVLLSLLAKHSQWEQAIDAWQAMKAMPALSKPSPVTYGLGILATHKHSWSATLSLYQELLKTHGYANTKEVVTLRVLRSLEDSKRFAEVQKLELLIEKAKAKTKKKKPQ